MKKVLCCFLVIIMSFALCCCKTEKTEKIKQKASPLKDGTETYYVNEYDINKNLIHSSRYTSYDRIIEEYEYSYTYDLNGKLFKIIKKDAKNGCYTETIFNKFRNKTEEISYNKNKVILNRKEFMKNGNIKKKVNYKNGSETGYILYDYYSDNQLKNATEYSVDGKAVKITTYYKNKLLYQIKQFNKDGMIEKITKYSYNGDKLTKKSIYDSEFNLVQVTDYTKNPPEIIKEKSG